TAPGGAATAHGAGAIPLDRIQCAARGTREGADSDRAATVKLRTSTRGLAWRRVTGVERPLSDTQDRELRGLCRRHADHADQPAAVDVLLRHRGAVALHEERLVFRDAHQRAAAPDRPEESGHRLAHRRPGGLVVPFKSYPPGAAVDRALDEDEEPPDVDVLPERVHR